MDTGSWRRCVCGVGGLSPVANSAAVDWLRTADALKNVTTGAGGWALTGSRAGDHYVRFQKAQRQRIGFVRNGSGTPGQLNCGVGGLSPVANSAAVDWLRTADALKNVTTGAGGCAMPCGRASHSNRYEVSPAITSSGDPVEGARPLPLRNSVLSATRARLLSSGSGRKNDHLVPSASVPKSSDRCHAVRQSLAFEPVRSVARDHQQR
ncbi:hypothetical protein [Mycobacterium tuberculosis]|uniref:hypothetical protein n=1 Tax=Mycobacterium tuberculosis TaxID=1773 RepID=UPI00272A300F|nr:hypothetical protein [Mycobacterium tuberculosis]